MSPNKRPFQHFVSIEGMSQPHLEALMTQAEQFIKIKDDTLHIQSHPLETDTRMGLVFFEPSTRTRLSFEMAAHHLHIPCFHLNVSTSSTTKGETVQDTIQNLESMGMNVFVIRHSENGIAERMAQCVQKETQIINAGDGVNQHPTQALLDMLTIKRYAKKPFSELTVTIMGDILHSRVARSDIAALKILGVQAIRVVAPKMLLPNDCEALGVQVFEKLEEGIHGADVVMGLRLQHERMKEALITDKAAYHAQFGLKAADLRHANKDVIVLHPGPVNWGVEFNDDLKNHPSNMILKQVTMGVAARMSVIKMLGQQLPSL